MNMPVVTQQAYQMIPTSFDEAVKIAKMLASSDLVPKDYKGKPENVFVAMQWGAEIGLKGLQAIQNIAVINGRPSVWGDAALAIVQNRTDCEDVAEIIDGAGDNRTATCTIKRKGRSPVTRTFSVANAKTANLWGKQGPWQQYPDRMLQMRARGFAIRDAFPDALRGLNLAEELQGLDERDMGAAVVVPATEVAATSARPEREMYPDESFAANFPKWSDLVTSGKKTAEQIIAMVESKAVLSEDQRAAINGIGMEIAQ